MSVYLHGLSVLDIRRDAGSDGQGFSGRNCKSRIDSQHIVRGITARLQDDADVFVVQVVIDHIVLHRHGQGGRIIDGFLRRGIVACGCPGGFRFRIFFCGIIRKYRIYVHPACKFRYLFLDLGKLFSYLGLILLQAFFSLGNDTVKIKAGDISGGNCRAHAILKILTFL